MKALYSAIAFVIVSLTAPEAAVATPVDIASGTSGTSFLNQSFNETRGVTATPGVNLELLSMTLRDFDIGVSSVVGARVYNDSTQALIATQDQLAPAASDQTVTIPILVALVAGQAYRFAFFVDDGSGDMFDPDPPNLAGFLYSTGPFQVSAAWSIASDAFPTLTNTFVPHITLDVLAVPEPGILALVIVAFSVMPFVWRRKNPCELN